MSLQNLAEPELASASVEQKPRANIYTMMLVLAFFAIVVACVVLWMELKSYGDFPWWETKGIAPATTWLTPGGIDGGVGLEPHRSWLASEGLTAETSSKAGSMRPHRTGFSRGKARWGVGATEFVDPFHLSVVRRPDESAARSGRTEVPLFALQRRGTGANVGGASRNKPPRLGPALVRVHRVPLLRPAPRPVQHQFPRPRSSRRPPRRRPLKQPQVVSRSSLHRVQPMSGLPRHRQPPRLVHRSSVLNAVCADRGCMPASNRLAPKSRAPTATQKTW